MRKHRGRKKRGKSVGMNKAGMGGKDEGRLKKKKKKISEFYFYYIKPLQKNWNETSIPNTHRPSALSQLSLSSESTHINSQ